jgi:hypothetical protein
MIRSSAIPLRSSKNPGPSSNRFSNLHFPLHLCITNEEHAKTTAQNIIATVNTGNNQIIAIRTLKPKGATINLLGFQ